MSREDDLWRQRRALEVATELEPSHCAEVAYALRNPLNGSGGTTRGARYAASARRQSERAIGASLVPSRMRGPRAVVLLTRCSPKRFDDDGLAAALKSIRDGIAQRWQIDDGGPVVTWLTSWERCPRHVVRVTVWWTP
jgi:hypothetical protein